MIRAFQWDLARQVERLDWLLAQLPRYADWGYQELYLHLEDAVHYPSLPGVARADAYTQRELGKLVEAAHRAGIGVVPIVNLLGHTQYLIKVPALRDLNELRHPDGSPQERGQICPLHPRTLEVADQLFNDVRTFCTAGKIHVGLDESFHLGKHPLSREEVNEIGLAAHFARHAGRLHALVSARGLRMGMWADMLALLPEAIPLLPRGTIAYDWYYYPFSRHPRIELYNFREYDLSLALRQHDMEYWGCPMNGAFRYEPLPIFGDRLANIRSWWERCQRVDAAGFLVTSWEAYRLAIETTTVVDAAAASLWTHPSIDDPRAMLAIGFKRVFSPGGRGKSPTIETHSRAWARTALACDRHPFAGYARWELNERWDCTSTRTSFTRAATETRVIRRLQRQALPPPLAASIDFRRYLAERDTFVHNAARGVWRIRRLLARTGSERPAREPTNQRRRTAATLAPEFAALTADASVFARAISRGRTAARAMWARSRDPALHGQNEIILAADAARLKEWRKWLSRCSRQPRLALADTLVCGAWQLQLTVRNIAPALQKVVIEQQDAAAVWHVLGARFTIEFQAEAARPTTRISREWAVPVPDHRRPLRIAVRGLGQVAVANVELTNGVLTHRARMGTAENQCVVGSPAPQSGFPDIDWSRNHGDAALTFSDFTPEF